MSVIPVEWIVLIVFVLLCAGAIIAEILWLVRRGWATTGRAVAYVLITDLIGLGLGSLVVLTIFFIAFMMVMGPAGRGGNAPEAAYWACLILAIVIPPALLIVVKRLFLLLLTIRSGRAAWIYSIVISLLAIFVIFVPPSLLYYLIGYLLKWN